MDPPVTKCETPVNSALANDPPQQQQQQPANLSEQPTISNLSTETCKHAELTTSPSTSIINSINMNVDCAKLSNDEPNRQPEDPSLDSLTSFSTAFTISFGDENSAPSKRLGIKDSIRKFAPPKPHTIEKPRERSAECQDNSLTSIESAPAGLSKHFTRKGLSASSRSAYPTRKMAGVSSGARNQSRQNINDCVALLIDRMLCDQKASQVEEQKCLSNEPAGSRVANCKTRTADTDATTSTHSNRITQSMTEAQSTNDIVDGEIDFCEDKSDNGTYIVGADSESDAARKKIDELFGVVKSAEASVMADSRNNNLHEHATETRQSRPAIKKLSNRERQEHINRLAPRHPSKSRSSSSSHREEHQQQHEPPRSSSRQSNHSSDGRSSKAHSQAPTATITRRYRRSVSQSSRHSSNRNELSDADTRSSRSSLHNEVTESLQCSAISCHPNIIKFNRTFELRRKRLGLGEPNSRILSTASSSLTSTIVQQQQHHSTGPHESDSCGTMNNLMSSQRRHQNNSNTYKSCQINQQQLSSRSSNFCREDGGRFSLRMKNMVGLPAGSRPSNYGHYTQAPSNRSPQHNSYDTNNYISAKTSSPMHGVATSKAITISSPKYNTSTSVPYQSCDELEAGAATSTSTRCKDHVTKAQRFQRPSKTRNSADSEGEVENHYYAERLNCSTGHQQQMYDNNLSGDTIKKDSTRVCNSASKLHQQPPMNSSEQFKPGLNSLMISSISSLSLKICHSVCDVLVELSKKLPVEDDTRLILEEIMPEVKSTSRSPTSLEEIESPHIYLARTLKNFRRIEQMVAVMNNISSKIPPIDSSGYNASSSNYSNAQVSNNVSSNLSTTGNIGMVDTACNSDQNS